ncbi:MAG TPA: hypothetical protein VKB76_09275 [Ktedonobacterales bacterium]|nr:hypothetical protein [Ktedonobacterales bacterium]
MANNPDQTAISLCEMPVAMQNNPLLGERAEMPTVFLETFDLYTSRANTAITPDFSEDIRQA